MRKKAIRITQFLRKSIIDHYLETRHAKDYFVFLKSILALLVTELHTICRFFLTGCIGDKVKIDIKIYLLMLYIITTIRHQLGVNLSCIVVFHILKTMFLLSIIKKIKISIEKAVFFKIIF